MRLISVSDFFERVIFSGIVAHCIMTRLGVARFQNHGGVSRRLSEWLRLAGIAISSTPRKQSANRFESRVLRQEKGRGEAWYMIGQGKLLGAMHRFRMISTHSDAFPSQTGKKAYHTSRYTQPNIVIL